MTFSPSLGRWLQEDPTEFDAGDPNFYRAYGNNPINALDPSGLQTQLPVPGNGQVKVWPRLEYEEWLTKGRGFPGGFLRGVRSEMDRGCVGLVAARLNFWGKYPHMPDGVKFYKDLESEKKRETKPGEVLHI